MNPPLFSVIILTHNEEANLPGCLDSLQGCDDIHVLDSGSMDATVEIARARNIPVYLHPFQGFGQQRNWAIDNIPARYDWHFHLDADERLTPDLADEITAAVSTNPSVGGYLVPSKLMFAGRWLKHAGQYPGYQVRLFHRQRLRFVDHGHGQREQTAYPVGRLHEPLLHFAFSRGLDHWFARHAVYARREAEQAVGNCGGFSRDDISFRGLWSRDPVLRRRTLKALTARLPGRYFFRLFYLIIFKKAFLDGYPGIVYAHMLATYEAMVGIHLQMVRYGLKP